MSDINANIIVEPKEITITTNTNQLTVDASPINLNVFTGDSIAGGQPGEIQYNAGGVLGGVPTATYANGNFTLGNTDTVKLFGGANAYFLQTDGTGNITWAPGTINANTGNGIPVGANKQIQITDGTGNFVSAPGFTFDNASNLFTAPGNAYFTGNVTANYYFGNGAFLTGIDTSLISNGSTNLKSYSNIVNANSIAFAFSSNGNSNVVTINSAGGINVETINVQSGGSQFNGVVTFNASVFFLGPSPVNIGAGIITGKIENGNSNILLYGAGNSLDSVRISSNNVNNGFILAGNVATFIGNVNADKFIGNGYTLTNINGANVTGIVANANYAANAGNANFASIANFANFAGNATTSNTANTVINNAQPNITSLGNLIGLTVNGNTKTYNLNVNNDIANSPTYQFVPNAINVVTQVGTKSYVAVTNLGNNNNQTNTAVIFGDNGLGSFVANNDSFANINGSNLFLATQVTSMTSGNTSNKAASGILSWNVFGDNSDLANANSATATGLELNGTTGLAIIRGAPIDNSGVLATFSYGGDVTPTNSVGLRMTRRRGNGAVRQTLQPNDYIANIEWRGAQLNGATPAGNRFAKIGAKVDSTYVANNSAQPVGLEFVVVNTTANITHNFYSNGVVNFANDVVVTSNIIANNSNITNNISANNINITSNISANNSNITGVYIGNGSGLTSLTGANVTGIVANANYAAFAGNATTSNTANTVIDNAQPNITSVGNLTDLRIANGNIHLGLNAGLTNQGVQSIAIGSNAQQTNAGIAAVAIGPSAANIGQGNYSIAIGFEAGLNNLGANSIAIGTKAGSFANVPNNTIVLGNSPAAATFAQPGLYIYNISNISSIIGSTLTYTGLLCTSTTGNGYIVSRGLEGWPGNIYPSSNIYNLGTAGFRWGNLFLSGNATIAGNVTANNVNASRFMVLSSNTAAQLATITGTAGAMISVSDQDYQPAYWSVTDSKWKYVSNRANV